VITYSYVLVIISYSCAFVVIVCSHATVVLYSYYVMGKQLLLVFIHLLLGHIVVNLL
jgi:hypothetical protein